MTLQKGPLLMESVVDLITAKLKVDFPLRCAEADNQYSDGISLPPPADENYYISTRKQALGLPACYVVGGPAEMNYAGAPNYHISDDEVVLMLSAEDEDAEKLQRKVWRYQRMLFVICNQLELSDPDGRLKIQMIPRRFGVTDGAQTAALDNGQKRFRQDAVIEFGVYHYEKRLID